MTHIIKIERQRADAKLAGDKPFEIRKNDRGYQKGDHIQYMAVDPATHQMIEHPISQCEFEITYVREGQEHGLQPGYCVFADRPVPKTRKEKENDNGNN